ncbi:hypothetical protein JOF56_010711 [Kibdelosporangium banguiense]|uniref:DUF4394 domain-containing protein n=1 Tax=Kibdelosporangium banguiense TaxID=1365924 RepID=A0ABS4U286_9PSEU|nr:DUF4394 domain-containing protein [Kibdelosporangium banguiense]MBP2330326.1 hypothetical protein [Kibdelosporangium banguiense]
MKARMKQGIAAVAVALSAATAVVGTPAAGTGWAQVQSLRAFGISADGKLMATFTTDKPQTLDWVRLILGLVGDTAVIGIDFRVQNGLMYAVGNQGGIYTIKTPPQVSDPVVTKVSQLQVPLYGNNFGVDFNPAADRLRVISDNGQNLRHNLNDHTTIEDGTLTTPPPYGPTRGVTGAAYTNNDLSPDTATTLYDVATATDEIVIQSPANIGTLAPIGSIGFDALPNAGFDIYSDLTNGKTTSVTGFAILNPAGASTSSLYTVNLFTGATTSVGAFPIPLGDLAIALDTN